ncbi:hypothetical protein SteCoe_24013 [Stentor coeruleus]|uniref:non-specific serine/threonine protein kinase n=1 Tax=Stentor coeruleus TaxID=5963 RepID=A0A1R2BIJ0_9CILI|nr:hypothetical protein SteCoe_24013 [Stentor coeruleus]
MALKSTLKDYEVLNKLGQGSFGTVFKVRRKADKNFYVMKTINISQMGKRGQQEAINEVKILASLDNPYIVKYFDSFIENKTLHIIMEYCDKGDLSQAIRSQMGRLITENKIWKYFIQMCLGLEYIHGRKILHRDIKSLNVFLVRDDVVRIGDLGVAKVLANTAAFAHTMVGTPYYLSPELCEEKPYNVKSDVWAMGCVLYELCTLKNPFDALNQAALLLKIIKGCYIPVSTNYSAELREIVDQTLCKDYRKRPTISGILSRPNLKERAISLNILIPPGSVLYNTAIPIVKDPGLVYQSQMAIIEEEKIHAPRFIKVNESKNLSPAPNKNFAKGKIAEKDAKAPEKPAEKAQERHSALGKASDLDAKGKDKVPDKPKLIEKPKSEREVRQIVPKVEEKPIVVEEKPKEQRKLWHKPQEVKEKEINDIKNLPKAKLQPETPHINNIHFEPPGKVEPKQLEPKIKQNLFKVSPKNMVNKLENKVEAQKIIQNKAIVKSAPKIDNKQKIIKPGVQAPHFMPPQRPADLKAPKKEPDAPKVMKEIKEVQDLPDYPKKKVSIQILKPVLKKIEVKNFDILTKPIFEDLPFVFEQFGETIDWNFTQTGFSNKDFIPVAKDIKEEFSDFQVNYVKDPASIEISDQSDDELYLVSDSEGDEIDDHNDYENEEFEEEDKKDEDILEKFEKKKRELAEAIKLEEMRRNEIIKRVGQETFEEMYYFFKVKASNDGDLNESEQREIENFMYTCVSIENTDIIITISKLFHNESERIRLESEVASLQSQIL